MNTNKTKVPRNFLLLDAINKAGNYTHVTYGLIDENEDDKYLNNYVQMRYWNCTLLYDDGESLIVFKALCECTQKYPEEKPILKFSEESMEYDKVKNVCDDDGNFTENAKWNESMSLGDYLQSVLNIISHS